MRLAIALILALPALDDVAGERQTPAERLVSLKSTMKSYELTLRRDDAPGSLGVQEEPAFRVGRQRGNFVDGAIFLWLDDVGRPEAAMEAFLLSEPDVPNGKWIHEFTSLATGPIEATIGGKTRWSPTVPGLEFRAVPGAPKPANTPAARLRQMRAIADEFKADDDFGGSGWLSLRMLTTPIARFGKTGAEPEDGALFALVDGTDPEVFLFVEARKGKEGPEWQYALASMGCWAVKVRRDGKPVWELPRRSTGDPSKPLYNYPFWP